MRYDWNGIVATIVPPGVWPENALHDAGRIPRRKHMTWMRPGRVVKYVVAFPYDKHPYLFRERELLKGTGRGKVCFALNDEDEHRFQEIAPSVNRPRW